MHSPNSINLKPVLFFRNNDVVDTNTTGFADIHHFLGSVLAAPELYGLAISSVIVNRLPEAAASTAVSLPSLLYWHDLNVPSPSMASVLGPAFEKRQMSISTTMVVGAVSVENFGVYK